jgi:hypothetical protein
VAVTNVRSAKAFDPVLIFRFIARWAPLGGKMTPAAHVNKVCGLSRSAGVAVWREGGAPHSRPEAMLLEPALVSTPMRIHP